MVSQNIKHVPTSTYHPRANGQMDRYNSALIARLLHKAAKHQRNWNAFALPLTYAYNTQAH